VSVSLGGGASGEEKYFLSARRSGMFWNLNDAPRALFWNVLEYSGI
jgi:hypothetical protein